MTIQSSEKNKRTSISKIADIRNKKGLFKHGGFVTQVWTENPKTDVIYFSPL